MAVNARAVFLDKDGTLVEDVPYNADPERVQLAPGALEGLQLLAAAGYRLVVVSNQSGVAHGYFPEEALGAVEARLRELLATGGVSLAGLGSRPEALTMHVERLLEATGAAIVAVTLDSDGAIVFEHDRPQFLTYARAARQACVAGAGDTFTSALALALAAGAPTPTAAELASAAAAIVVGKERTAICSAQELREQVSAGGKYYSELTRLAARVEFYKQQGRKVVFTNGCFDILHRGHITYLNRAKSLGDVLVVGVNSDDGIRRLKGPVRPINTLEDRIQVLAALSCVDHLIAFDEDTPCNLVRALKPNVFVKGGDYTRERLPEAPLVEELGGVVRILPFLQDRSTTGIIERIQEVYGRPGALAAGGAHDR